ncbi:hypothetical protein PCANB_001902 [Pneumocystis canis]|nr:hypothetical protein PCK1_001687 [Pneumocystis canis]KAG5440332.1 hypothetical protein PCANB_001902 [Pneumocystis canis]
MANTEISITENEKSILFIYQNLLIFEESLRQEYISLYLRRRKYSMFFICLLSWIAYFFHSVFITPSHYYYIFLLDRLCLLAGIITFLLFYLSGLYSKTLTLPRKFIPYTNKCLRPYNLKIVPNYTTKSRLLQFLPHRLLTRPDLGEGGVRLVLLSKGFDRNFCEGWEIFRQEYWINEQNRLMKKKDKKRTENSFKHNEKLLKKKKRNKFLFQEKN